MNENNLSFFQELEALVRKYENRTVIFDFDVLLNFFEETAANFPKQGDLRLKCFDVSIIDKAGSAVFKSLNLAKSDNKNVCGFSLARYPLPTEKTSAYFDGRDVHVSFVRDEFVSAKLYNDAVLVTLKRGSATICW